MIAVRNFRRVASRALACRVAVVLALVPGAAPGIAAEWTRAGVNTNPPVWGLKDGLMFAIHPAGFGGDQGGPRGLIRIGYPTLPEGRLDLINFIAVEPVVKGRRGYSELEKSDTDGRHGRVFEVAAEPGAGVADALPGQIVSREGVETLTVNLRIERFSNGARVRLVLSQRSDAPGELQLAVHAGPGSEPIDSCILTATMGNKARTRLLWVDGGAVSSKELFRGHSGTGFTAHAFFPVSRLPRSAAGDVLVAVTTDESDPSAAVDGFAPFWRYLGTPVTQYWRKPVLELNEDLRCAVNARHTYWMSKDPIPGGLAYENFELVEPFRDGGRFIFGISRQLPARLLE